MFALLIILGIIFVGFAIVSVVALQDDEFREVIENHIKPRSEMVSDQEKKVESDDKLPVIEPEVVAEVDMTVDKHNEIWDEQILTNRLMLSHNQPALFEHLISSIKERIRLGQDYRTTEKNIELLESTVKKFGVAKNYLVALDNLKFHEMEREIRRRELEIKNEDLENKRKAQQELEAIKLQRDKLKIQVEVAQLNRQISEIENPTTVPPKHKPTVEDLREQERQEQQRNKGE
jgi:hypothetical protein